MYRTYGTRGLGLNFLVSGMNAWVKIVSAYSTRCKIGVFWMSWSFIVKKTYDVTFYSNYLPYKSAVGTTNFNPSIHAGVDEYPPRKRKCRRHDP